MIDQRWGALGKKVEPAWGPERELSALDEIEHRTTRRRRAGRVGASILALAVVAGGVRAFVGLRRHEPTSVASADVASPSAPPAAAIETVTVTQLSPETIVDPMPDRNGRGFVLRAGGARFFVPHDTRHPFMVVAGDVTIEDLGTTFTVRYLPADRVDIAVEEGRVKVSAPGAAGAARSTSELGPGQRLEVALSSPALSSPAPSSSTAPPALEKRPHSTTASSSWRPLAEKGRYDEAHTALKKAGPNAVRDETADLLLAADAARLSGYPAEALPYLERVVRAHERDPRSSLASFTLGRVLLDELGRPREAADAFARARAAGGPLAEDALAREVEAAARSGDTTRSRELARDYQSLYPHGRRAKAVSRFGGLD
ncbi:MAG: transrane sensor [Myxococcales bacterium]|jgi:transmembrane sensor|nr:transrane sensor [Myxococcales bacterium]